MGGWPAGWVGVEIEVDANSAPTELELELGLSLAIVRVGAIAELGKTCTNLEPAK